MWVAAAGVAATYSYWRGSGGLAKLGPRMSGWGSTRMAARLLCAAGLPVFAAAPASAQTAAPAAPPVANAAELDPSASLAPMPDLGVDWPDLNAKDATEASVPTEQ